MTTKRRSGSVGRYGMMIGLGLIHGLIFGGVIALPRIFIDAAALAYYVLAATLAVIFGFLVDKMYRPKLRKPLKHEYNERVFVATAVVITALLPGLGTHDPAVFLIVATGYVIGMGIYRRTDPVTS